MFHCHSSDPVNFCLEIRVSSGSKGALTFWLLSLHSGLCPFSHTGLMSDFSDWDHNAVCMGLREILVIGAEQRRTEHGWTGKALRMRKVDRGKQERASRPGLWPWEEVSN